MFAFFSNPPKAPQRVPTDLVVPVGFFDNTIIFRTFVLYTLFVFDDVLDPERLRTSLERVVSRPGWNKLGARLRRNVRLLPYRPALISNSCAPFRIVENLSTIYQPSSPQIARQWALAM